MLDVRHIMSMHCMQGRNKVANKVITQNREFFTWEVAYLGLRSEVLPDRMRAAFCDLLIGEFSGLIHLKIFVFNIHPCLTTWKERDIKHIQ